LKIITTIYRKLASYTGSRYASLILAGLFYIEAIFFFIPIDALLVVYCSERREKAFRFALIATTFSILGGITSYYIGYAVWEAIGKYIISFLSSPESFDYACSAYHKHDTLAVLIGCFTPIPFKVISLAAGLCRLTLWKFALISYFARGIRFFIIALLCRTFGQKIKDFLDNYFHVFIFSIAGLMVAGILAIKFLS
jgi:membrane protein YqaA with SNARE-associated domain